MSDVILEYKRRNKCISIGDYLIVRINSIADEYEEELVRYMDSGKRSFVSLRDHRVFTLDENSIECGEVYECTEFSPKKNSYLVDVTVLEKVDVKIIVE